MNKTFITKICIAAVLSIIAAGPTNTRAEEAAAAPAAAPAPTPDPAAAPKLTVDQLLEQLLAVNPDEITARIAALKGEVAKMQTDAVALREQAAALDAKASDTQRRLVMVEQLVAAIKPAAQAAAAPAPGNKEMAAAAAPAAPEMKPEEKPTEMKMAAADAADTGPKITYADNVQAIFLAKCASCHNQDKAKGGLAIDTYEKLMEGGGSGKVITVGQASQSRLYRLLTHEEEPKMPLGGSKLDDASLEIIKKWIDAGALKDKNSKMVAAAKPADAPVAVVPEIKVEGELPMPLKQADVKLASASGPLAVRAIAASPVAPLIAVSGQREVLLYNSETLELLRAVPFAEGMIECIKFSPNGSLLVVAGGEGGKVGLAAVYDVITGQRLGEYGRTFDTMLAADITLDHTQIAVGGTNKKVKVFSTATGEMLYEVTKHTDWIQAVAFSLDGWLLATGDRSGGLFTWLAENGRDANVLRGHEGAINSLAFRMDSQMLASAGADGKVLLWEMQDGKNVKGWAAHAQGALSVSYARDGRLLTAGVDKETAVWDGEGKQLIKFPPLGDWAYAACFASQDSRAVAGSWMGEIKVWMVADAKEVGAFKLTP